MEKELILKKLEEARIQEELAIPLYVSHIQQTIFWSGLNPEKQKVIIENLKVLDVESERHAKYFDKILQIHKKL